VVAYEMIYGERPFKVYCPINLIKCVDQAYTLHESRRKGVGSGKIPGVSLSTTAGKTPLTSCDTSGSGLGQDLVSSVAIEDSISSRMSQMRMIDCHGLGDDQLSNTDDHVQRGSRRLPAEDMSMSPESHWDFDPIEDEHFSNDLKVPLPEVSKLLGQVSQEVIEILRGLLDIRPSMRLGSRMCPHKVHEAPLLVKWKVNDEKTLCAKQIRPSFAPGRKFLLFGTQRDPNNVGNDDPYSAAVGKGVSMNDLTLSVEDQAKFDGFFHLAGSSLPL